MAQPIPNNQLPQLVIPQKDYTNKYTDDASRNIAEVANYTEIEKWVNQYLNQQNLQFHAYLSPTATGITNGTFTTIPFDTILFDQAKSFNTSTHAYTIPSRGLWHLQTTGGLTTAPTSGEFIVALHIAGSVNGTLWTMRTPMVSDFPVSTTQLLIELSKGDIITSQMYQTAGSGAFMSGGANLPYVTFLQGKWMGPF